jgi:hypothetical protein
MIRVKATWEYKPENKFPDELHLWTKCPDCDEYVDVLYYFCYYIPNIPKKITGNGMEITVRCPICEYKFMLVSIDYYENN